MMKQLLKFALLSSVVLIVLFSISIAAPQNTQVSKLVKAQESKLPQLGYWEGIDAPIVFHVAADGSVNNLRLDVSSGNGTCTLGLEQLEVEEDNSFLFVKTVDKTELDEMFFTLAELSQATLEVIETDTSELIVVQRVSGRFDTSTQASGDFILIDCGSQFVFSGDSITPWNAEWKSSLQLELGESFTHEGNVFDIGFSPDGEFLALAGGNSVALWNIETGEIAQAFGDDPSIYINRIAISPNGEILASSGGNDVVLWDVATGEVLFTLSKHTGMVAEIVFSPNGDLLVSGGLDETLIVWDVATGEIQQTLENAGSVTSIAFSPDGTLLASTSFEKNLFLWDVESGAIIQIIEYDQVLKSAAFSPDGKILAVGSQQLSLLDTTTWQEISSLATEVVDSIAFSPDGGTLAAINLTNKSIRLWDVATRTSLYTLYEPGRLSCLAHSLAFSPDGSTLVTASCDQKANVWNIRSMQ